jgi:branched-chain amino acid aminotransferase
VPDLAFFNNKIVPIEEAVISVKTHALHYGTSAFEGIRVNWCDDEKKFYIFRMPEHYERLLRSCRILKMDLPYSIDQMCQISVELVEKCDHEQDIYIRPIAYKSTEVVGVKLHGLDCALSMFVIPFGPYIDVNNGIKCGTSSWRKINGDQMPNQAKIAGPYINHAMAKTEAIENGFDEAILLTQKGYVSEGSGENIFIVMDGKIITPPPSDNILVGITRNSVIELAKSEFGLETIERSIDRSELYVADECFMTGTAAHVAPVIEIDRRKVGDGKIGPITKKLQQLYFDVEQGRNAKYMHWCTAVTPKK